MRILRAVYFFAVLIAVLPCGAQPAPDDGTAPATQAAPQSVNDSRNGPLPPAAPLPAPDRFSLSETLQDLGVTLSNQGAELLEKLPYKPPQKVIRTIVAMVAFLVLAYLGGHPGIRNLERRLNIAQFTTTGLPFVLLGFVASQPIADILTPTVMRDISPVLPFGLGWIGFVIGARFRGAALNSPDPGVGTAVFITSGLPFLVIFGLSAYLFLGLPPLYDPTNGSTAWRDAIILATAGTMAARSAPHFFTSFTNSQVSSRIARVIEFEQLAGVLGMLMISAFFRPFGGAVSWQLPGAAWLFVIFGIGTIMGLLIRAILSTATKGPQFTAALLGSVAFTAGMASYLRLSPIGVCCIAGAVLANIGGPWRDYVRELLERVERPVYLIFLVLAGALWHPWEWQGWALMFIFATGRLLSKWIAAVLIGQFVLHPLEPIERWTLTGAPMGALSVGIVVSAQDLYSGPSVGWIVTAVIGASFLLEVVLQSAGRRIVRSLGTAPEIQTTKGTILSLREHL